MRTIPYATATALALVAGIFFASSAFAAKPQHDEPRRDRADGHRSEHRADRREHRREDRHADRREHRREDRRDDRHARRSERRQHRAHHRDRHHHRDHHHSRHHDRHVERHHRDHGNAGAFLGGLMLGAIANNHHDHHERRYSTKRRHVEPRYERNRYGECFRVEYRKHGRKVYIEVPRYKCDAGYYY